MRTLLIAALLVASTAFTRPTLAASASRQLLAQSTPTSSTASDDDEDEDEEETPKPAASDAPVATPVTTPAVPATNRPSTTTSPAADSREQQLVSGAPLYNPNVAVHIVEKKRFSDGGKHEVVLYPAWVQVNGKFTQHAGTAISYVYHLQENFGFQLTPLFNWVATESPLNRELVDKVRVEAQAATSLLLKWGVLAGVEVTPLYGKFAFYENTMAHFSLVVNAGAGLGSTLHQLKPDTTDTPNGSPATFGDTGFKFTGGIGIGARVQLGDRFALRLEVRDLVYTARVDSVNGCNAADMQLLREELGKSRTTFDQVPTSASCQKERFNDDPTDSSVRPSADIPLAERIVKEPSSDVLNNVGFYAGFSVLF